MAALVFKLSQYISQCVEDMITLTSPLPLSVIVCSFCNDIRPDVESHQGSSLCSQKSPEWTSGMNHITLFPLFPFSLFSAFSLPLLYVQSLVLWCLFPCWHSSIPVSQRRDFFFRLFLAATRITPLWMGCVGQRRARARWDQPFCGRANFILLFVSRAVWYVFHVAGIVLHLSNLAWNCFSLLFFPLGTVDSVRILSDSFFL